MAYKQLFILLLFSIYFYLGENSMVHQLLNNQLKDNCLTIKQKFPYMNIQCKSNNKVEVSNDGKTGGAETFRFQASDSPVNKFSNDPTEVFRHQPVKTEPESELNGSAFKSMNPVANVVDTDALRNTFGQNIYSDVDPSNSMINSKRLEENSGAASNIMINDTSKKDLDTQNIVRFVKKQVQDQLGPYLNMDNQINEKLNNINEQNKIFSNSINSSEARINTLESEFSKLNAKLDKIEKIVIENFNAIKKLNNVPAINNTSKTNTSFLETSYNNYN